MAIALAGNVAMAAGKQGVVLQVSDDDPRVWTQALNNAMNVIQDLGQDTPVEIVAYGPGLKMFMIDSEVNNRLTDASKMGIALIACGNTMRRTGVTSRNLHPQVRVVPSGIVEIIQKQKAGWTYVKP